MNKEQDGTHAPVALDAEAGAAWKAISAAMFDGAGPVINSETLEAVRAFDLTTREALLTGRAFSEEILAIPVEGGELEISVFTPDGHAAGSPGVYWIHGGGMVTGTRYMATDALDAADAIGAMVISIEYRLAPEHPAPIPVSDCYAGLRWLFDNSSDLGVDSSKILLGGLSAGGGLAASTALLARDNDGPQVLGLMLLAPMLDDRMQAVSTQQFGDDLLWTRASNEFGWSALLGDRFQTDAPLIYDVPGRASDLSGLPDTFIDVGSADIFRDDAVGFASRIWSAGGAAELHVWSGGYHGYEGFAPTSAITLATIDARRSWLRRLVS